MDTGEVKRMRDYKYNNQAEIISLPRCTNGNQYLFSVKNRKYFLFFDGKDVIKYVRLIELEVCYKKSLAIVKAFYIYKYFPKPCASKLIFTITKLFTPNTERSVLLPFANTLSVLVPVVRRHMLKEFVALTL